MKRLMLVFIAGCVSLSARSEGPQWFTDLPSAQEKARQENKFVMLDFTGSDWCVWCKKLKAEVFDQPEFADFAQANLVLVEVDFPKEKPLEAAQKEANQRLAQTYQITGYPTIVVLTPTGELAGKGGYVPGGPGPFDDQIARVLKARGNDPSQPPPSAAPPADKPEPAPTPTVIVAPPAVHYGALALKGISGTKDRRMVLINNATLMTGEKAVVHAEDKDVVVYCKEIRDDSVLITANGEPMELKLGQH